MLTLSAWGNAWIEYHLDPDTRAHSTHFVKNPKANEKMMPDGFGSFEPVFGIWRRFYALYAYNGRLYFQAGHKTWDVTDGLRDCKFWSAGYGLCSGLIMTFMNGDTHRPVLIHPMRFLVAKADPTYDGIDAESDHFFLFLRQHLPNLDWRHRIITRQQHESQSLDQA